MRKAVVFISSFILISAFLLSVSPRLSPTSAQQTVQNCFSVDSWTDYLLCTNDPTHIICGSPAYACCSVPPGAIGFTPECETPPPPCLSPNQCIDRGACPAGYAIPIHTSYCPSAGLGLIDPICCAPTNAPPPTPGPSPTVSVGLPPSFCGDHLQPCCGIQSGGDPGLGTCPDLPGLFCTGIALGESICCLQNDTEPRCWTGIGVTPIPPPTPYSTHLDIFCTSANGTPTSATTKWIYTAFGCLEYDAYQLISSLLILLTRVAGGIGLILLIFSGFQFVTAGGDPKKVQAGKELLTSTLVGISLILLSVVILNFIGVNVLGLSNLGLRFSP